MSVFEFTDYRAFLRSFLAALPKQGHGFINRIALHLGVHASLVSQILAGKKDFNLEQAHALCPFIGLVGLDADYFLLLVERERAGTHGLKNYFDNRLRKMKEESLQVKNRIIKDKELSDYERSVFYSSWLYSAIRLWTSIGDGKTLDQIAERFDVNRGRVSEILQFLVENKLCVETNGLYKMGPQRTHLDRKSPFITKLHGNWRLQALQHAEDLSEEELMFTGPLSISREDFQKIREQLMTLIKSVSSQVTKSVPEDVACLNLDFFWIKK